VLWGWGVQAVWEGRRAQGARNTSGFQLATPGKLSPEQYDSFVRDTVNFLEYIAEPAQLQRKSLGFPVIAFLIFFTLLAYLLKKEYWKDVK
jgi:ubiquinol-cytochrome c reductase cytochrome c1 subunit